ncbi:hypothetical protein HRbin40_00935 [bacterium HR40]|nr:hypothetical protein HRbin40_00935 [bacterium HR40]
MRELWPWLAIGGLGAFHGLNPAMGWLFAVALGLHRGSGRVVAFALLPIALGHLAAVAGTLAVFLGLGLVLDGPWLRRVGGLLLVGWAFWHWRFGRRHRVRFGMTVGSLGLFAWSSLMASAHGAGLMLIPAFLPICFTPAGEFASSFGTSVGLALAAVLLHTGAMLATTALLAFVVYRLVGVAVLRQAWINLDIPWTAALVVSGSLLLLWP